MGWTLFIVHTFDSFSKGWVSGVQDDCKVAAAVPVIPGAPCHSERSEESHPQTETLRSAQGDNRGLCNRPASPRSKQDIQEQHNAFRLNQSQVGMGGYLGTYHSSPITLPLSLFQRDGHGESPFLLGYRAGHQHGAEILDEGLHIFLVVVQIVIVQTVLHHLQYAGKIGVDE